MQKIAFGPVFIVAALTLIVVGAAQASDITFQTGAWAGCPAGPTAVQSAPSGSTYNYQTIIDPLVANPAPGYCTTKLTTASGMSNQISCGGPNANIAYKTVIKFNVPQDALYTFRAGGDWGYGATMILDYGLGITNKGLTQGSSYLLQTRLPSTQCNTDADMWWNGNFNTVSDTQFLRGSITLTAGPHTLAVYALEGCCDGAGQIEFDVNNQNNFKILSATDGLDPVNFFGVPGATAAEGRLYTFTPTTIDPGISNSPVWSIVNKPSWANFDPTTGSLTGTPPVGLTGTAFSNIVISFNTPVSFNDGKNSGSLDPFAITITSFTISGSPSTTVQEGQPYTFTPAPLSGNPLWSIANKPSWASFDPSTGSLTGTPPVGIGGSSFANITISAAYGSDTNSLPPFTIAVTSIPVVVGPGVGPQGPAGPPGPQGPAGPAGPIGPQGFPGLNGTSFTYKNVWTPAAPYSANDVVTKDGQSYIALLSSTGVDPVADVTATGGNWALMAAAGATGPQGLQGLIGAMGPMGLQGLIGAPGTPGPQGLQGMPGAVGPAGVGTPGPTGPQGPAGANGASFNFKKTWAAATVYEINDVVTEGGQSYIALASNTGTDPANDVTASGGSWALMAAAGGAGPQGPAGSIGPMGLIGLTGAIGPPGVQGTPGATGPLGPAGPVGQRGATGLAGPQGPAGPAGAKGATGPIGLQGPAGVAGAKGATGANGATGPAGPVGPTGAKGATGPAGPQGPSGTVLSDSSFNTSVGTGALHSTTPGGANTANGFDALYFNSGQFNAAFGVGSMYANTTGSMNVAVGDGALAINTTGSNNIAVGSSAGALLTNGSNNIDVGNPGGNGESGKIRIGTNNVQNATFIAGITSSKITGSPVYITASGQLGVLASSERYKTAITTMIPNSIKLQMLRPVTFHLKTEPEGTMQYGLIAEEVNQIYPELVIRNDQGGVEGVRYDELAPIVLEEVQQQQRRLADQNHNLAAQAAQLKELNQEIAELKKLNRAMQLAIQSIQTRDAEAKKR